MTISALLSKLFGTENVMDVEFRQIDQKTKRKSLFFKKIRGSIRLISGKVKLPHEWDQEVDRFISTPLP